ncbi:MAG: thioesterase family protein, partial [Pseudomonadota bacterium]|nr:thioesterase family protein [Pseudomonadota bacterium]
MSAHPFDAAVALQPQADGTFLGHTSAAYANMVGPFGGVTAAQALNAVLQHSQRLGDPISLTVNFAAALDDGPFIVSVRPARTNRSTQHWVIEMQQNGETVLTGTA